MQGTSERENKDQDYHVLNSHFCCELGLPKQTAGSLEHRQWFSYFQASPHHNIQYKLLHAVKELEKHLISPQMNEWTKLNDEENSLRY